MDVSAGIRDLIQAVLSLFPMEGVFRNRAEPGCRSLLLSQQRSCQILGKDQDTIPRKTFTPCDHGKTSPWPQGFNSLVIPWEVVKSIELSDSLDRWDALPIDLLRNPGLSARPVIQLEAGRTPRGLPSTVRRAGGFHPPSCCNLSLARAGLSPAGGNG